MITVYASSAFVIIELVNNVAEPLNLPERLSTIVILVLAIGFPVAVILSWIFDMTPTGVEKTQPLGDEEETEIPVVRNRWKIATYISVVAIVGLIVLNLFGGSTRIKAGDIQSLVVLPFENFTGDEQMEYFVSGMHASLIQDMGRVSACRVVNRTSSRAFPEEETIWIAEYKEEKSQILNLYNTITKQIADEIMIELTPSEERILAKSRPVDLEAYDEYMKGFQYVGDFSLASLTKAREYFESAMEKDPDWAPLYTGLAGIWVGLQHLGYVSPSVASQKIQEYLDQAFDLDPELSVTHSANATRAHWVEWDWEKSEREFIRALALNPSDAATRIFYAHLLACLQRPDEALQQGRLALELDPLNPLMKCWYGTVLNFIGDCETSLAVMEEVLTDDPEHFLAISGIAEAASQCRDYDKAIEKDIQWLQMTVGQQVDEQTIKEIERIYDELGFQAAHEEIARQLEKISESSYIGFINLVFSYVKSNQPDKAMDWMEKGFEAHDPQMIYITVYDFDLLFDHPRFLAMVEKMNLPLPVPV